MQRSKIDTGAINAILRKGDVDFSRSNTDLDSCKTYMITGKSEIGELDMLFENCDSIATLQKIWKKD